MDTQALPLVTFGKYKGQPITSLLNDTKYLEWCKQQEWFKKYPIIYNICVNQIISSTTHNSKTPEHNKLQNLFLEDNNVIKLLKKVLKKDKKNVSITKGDITFEGMFNWDLIVENYLWCLCDCDSTIPKICDCEVYKKYIEQYKIPKDGDDLKLNNLYCEIKPCLGDDYPCVLRKMKTQIELTNNYVNKYNEDKLKYYENDYDDNRQYWRFRKDLYNYSLSQEYIRNPQYVLIIKEFNSTTTTKEQLITIFNQAYIRIVFIDELFDDLQNKSSIEQVDEQSDLTLSVNESKDTVVVIHKDNLLETQQKLKQAEEKLAQAEERIKELENEICALKSQKNTKSIKDYFQKK